LLQLALHLLVEGLDTLAEAVGLLVLQRGDRRGAVAAGPFAGRLLGPALLGGRRRGGGGRLRLGRVRRGRGRRVGVRRGRRRVGGGGWWGGGGGGWVGGSLGVAHRSSPGGRGRRGRPAPRAAGCLCYSRRTGGPEGSHPGRRTGRYFLWSSKSKTCNFSMSNH